ncbi:hypothetical protein HBI56_150200 [Parastagonospora nodorum]|nr:hypothetical protein HBH53_151460 [Parastagonospora nodorum]KAH3995290.1 hypothetical protein HBI10_174030 [Parastagonospora nodorum]KAH4016057.1 hypothetical protein HBI13_152720 [Parastagonospora nodorum]KAH4017408.1 hypothetical protein HBI09_196900 [Parastagonospora nodorum]KAH4117187.1 hypothetical protein HBH47_154690 [Parastagonospora nodorum]
MRIVLLVGALAALATAFPRPQDDTPDDTPDEPSDDPATISLGFPTATIPVTLTTSLNIPVTESFEIVKPTKSKRPHWEPIPIFTKQCKCDVATVRYPCWATDALQKCNYEENFSYGCYMEAAGGCPTPTRACRDLFKPTPMTGRHPCDFGGSPPPLPTLFPNITTLVPILTTSTWNVSLPTGNITVPVVPTANVTLPVLPTGNVTLPTILPV